MPLDYPNSRQYHQSRRRQSTQRRHAFNVSHRSQYPGVRMPVPTPGSHQRQLASIRSVATRHRTGVPTASHCRSTPGQLPVPVTSPIRRLPDYLSAPRFTSISGHSCRSPRGAPLRALSDSGDPWRSVRHGIRMNDRVRTSSSCQLGTSTPAKLPGPKRFMLVFPAEPLSATVQALPDSPPVQPSRPSMHLRNESNNRGARQFYVFNHPERTKVIKTRSHVSGPTRCISTWLKRRVSHGPSWYMRGA